jgi:hypothetical protein
MELKELQRHILTLATLPQTGDPVISCYLNRETGQPNGRHMLEERVQLLRGSLLPKWRWEFEEGLNRIDAYLRQGVPERVVGLAMSLAPENSRSSCHSNSTYPCPIGSQSTRLRISTTWSSLRILTTVMPSCFAPKLVPGSWA